MHIGFILSYGDGPTELEVLAKRSPLRKDPGVSQEELAHRAKVHRTFVGAVERSEQNISIDNVEKIAKALEVKPHQLLIDERR